jgi:hypothetical protein
MGRIQTIAIDEDEKEQSGEERQSWFHELLREMKAEPAEDHANQEHRKVHDPYTRPKESKERQIEEISSR